MTLRRPLALGVGLIGLSQVSRADPVCDFEHIATRHAAASDLSHGPATRTRDAAARAAYPFRAPGARHRRSAQRRAICFGCDPFRTSRRRSSRFVLSRQTKSRDRERVEGLGAAQ